MKKLSLQIISLLIISFSVLNGCTDYLDTQPYSVDTVDKLYTSEDGAELGLTGCYNLLNAESVQGTWGATFVAVMPFMLNGGTDEVATRDGFTDVKYAPLGNYTYTSQNPSLEGNWFSLFAGVNRANYLLEQIDGVDFEDEDRKEEIRCEAHFLRGFYYFYLSAFYGGVPLFTTSEQSVSEPRSSLENVYGQVISDLTYAYQNFPSDSIASTKSGRANKWSAAGYLAKVYTYLASCKNNNVGADLNFELNSFNWVDASAMYNKAKLITEDIIENSDLELTEHYDYLFRETTKSYQKEESLFSLAGSENVSNGNFNLMLYFQIPIGSSSAGGGYGWYRPMGELFYKYHSSDPRRMHNLTEVLDTENAIESIDGVNYFVPDTLDDPTSAYYCVGKFRYRDPDEKSISSAWSDGDIVLLRYADILLLNAEARYFSGDESGARERLSEVRSRIATDENELEMFNNVYYNSDFLTELLDSRSRELCFEGWRRIDLIRFGKLGEVVNSLSEDTGKWNTIVPIMQSYWNSNKIWFPIPKSDIELSENLEQNPGYN